MPQNKDDCGKGGKGYVVWDSETSQDKIYKGDQKEHVINYISARDLGQGHYGASVIAIKYLEWRSKKDNVDIKHAGNGREEQVGKYKLNEYIERLGAAEARLIGGRAAHICMMKHRSAWLSCWMLRKFGFLPQLILPPLYGAAIQPHPSQLRHSLLISFFEVIGGKVRIPKLPPYGPSTSTTEEQRKLISEIRERFSNLESKKIYAVAHYLDPRFKDQFVPNRLEFASKIHSWIKSDILLPTNSGEMKGPHLQKRSAVISLRPARINLLLEKRQQRAQVNRLRTLNLN
uniref:Glutathione S-transferase n=1 Tax=Globodera rostochiensis TaxID=31243 RepID=A0A914HLY0_GLORO